MSKEPVGEDPISEYVAEQFDAEQSEVDQEVDQANAEQSDDAVDSADIAEDGVAEDEAVEDDAEESDATAAGDTEAGDTEADDTDGVTHEVVVDDLAEDRPADGDDAELRAVLEAIVYVTEEPLTAQQMAAALGQPIDKVSKLLTDLVEEYQQPGHGLSIREVAGGYRMSTKAEHHEAVRAFVKKLTPPLKLSLAALETLAVIAYKQPVTAPEIMEIRGVQGAGVLKTLLDRKLIAEGGRKNVVGKPILYKTTKEFLIQFGLKNVKELPTLKEFEELGRMELVEETMQTEAETNVEDAAAKQSESSEATEESKNAGDADFSEPAKAQEESNQEESNVSDPEAEGENLQDAPSDTPSEESSSEESSSEESSETAESAKS